MIMLWSGLYGRCSHFFLREIFIVPPRISFERLIPLRYCLMLPRQLKQSTVFVLSILSRFCKPWVIIDRTGQITLLGSLTVDPGTVTYPQIMLRRSGVPQWTIGTTNSTDPFFTKTDLHFRLHDSDQLDPVSVLILSVDAERSGGVPLPTGHFCRRIIADASLEVRDSAIFLQSVSMYQTAYIGQGLSLFRVTSDKTSVEI